MGHTRLGPIPKGRKWAVVVEHFAKQSGFPTSESEVSVVAAQAISATLPALRGAASDPALQRGLVLLWRITQAARDEDWKDRLADAGVELGPEDTLFDLVSEAHRTLDEYIWEHGGPTDIGELAQKALGATLSDAFGSSSQTLFGDSGEELRLAVRRLSRRRAFGQLGQTFFGRFTSSLLKFYLSRITARRSGEAELQIGDLSRFDRLLDHHCEESALIVKDFTAQWFSKTAHEATIDEESVARFLPIALQKLIEELETQAA